MSLPDVRRVGRFATVVALGALSLAAAVSASAQPVARHPTRPRSPAFGVASATSNDPAVLPTDLLGHFGAARVEAMAADQDANVRLRAILRAREVGTPDALSSLLPAKDLLSLVRTDGRLLMALVRTLADHADEAQPRSVLGAIVSMPSASAAKPQRNPTPIMPDDAAQSELARQMAAMALASSTDPEGARTLFALLPSSGSPAIAAASALRAYPPVDRAWTRDLPADRANLDLARTSGDLRDVSALEEIAERDSAAARAADRSTDLSLSVAPGPAKKTPAAGKNSEADANPSATLGTAERVLLLAALGRFDDAHVIPMAMRLHGGAENALRVASLEARIAVGGANVADDCAALIADDVTASDGIRLAASIPAPAMAVVKALAARLAVTSDDDARARILALLGRMPTAAALDAIVPFVHDARLSVDAVNAIARSPLAHAAEILATLAARAETRRLALRGYLVRASARGERLPAIDTIVQSLLTAVNADDRALARSIAVAAGDMTAAAAADDHDPRVVRAVLAIAPHDADVAQIALGHADPTTRALAMANLASTDPARIAGLELSNRLRVGDIDAPFAARALAARAHESDDATLALLASPDAVVHEEALRGYGASKAPDRAGRIADLYAYATDVSARRVLLDTLVHSVDDADLTPALRQTLHDAGRLDPDAECRAIARGVRFGADEGQTVWLHLQTPAAMPPRSPRPYSGLLLTTDGPRPVVFDADGDAVVLHVPSGPTRLRLAPRVTSYEPALP